MTLREIEAPPEDDLTAAQVAVSIGKKDAKSVMRLVNLGLFPEPIDIGGVKTWVWEDVVWYRLHKRLMSRLRRPQPAGTPPVGDEAPRIGANPRPKRIPADSSGSAAAEA